MMAHSIQGNEMHFVAPNHHVLNQLSSQVTQQDLLKPEFQKQLDEMVQFAGGNQGDQQRPVLVGLAAPQIGIAKRIILVDVKANGKGQAGDLRIFINPEIAWASPEMVIWYEGCYSTANVTGVVSRPQKILLKALDRKGEPIEETFEGYTARIIQHEIDHLNGIRFPMRIRNSHDLHFVEKHEFPLYRNQEGWRHWERKCSWEEWLAIISQ